jgi:hypothetical protein
MNANFYLESTGPFAGQTLTFTGVVLGNTLVSPYTSVAFIKDFAADYSSFNTITANLVNGVFSVSLALGNDPGRHVQYGFETIGPNVWSTDVAAKGMVLLTAIPEPSSAILATLGLLGIGQGRARRRIA